MNKKGIAVFVGLFIDIVAIIVSFVLKNNFPKADKNFILVEGGMVVAIIGLIFFIFMDDILKKYISFAAKNDDEPSTAYRILYHGCAFVFYIFPLISLIILVICIII